MHSVFWFDLPSNGTVLGARRWETLLVNVVRIDDWRDARLEDYHTVRDPQLLRRRGLFVAESRAVVRILLSDTSFVIRSLLLTDAALRALETRLVERLAPETPVYVAGRELLRNVIGFDVHRGCLATAERGAPLDLAALVRRLHGNPLVVMLDAVSNPDNVGSVFRNAAAFGVGGMAVGPGCADPFYRKAIRTSMGNVFRLPFARVEGWAREVSALQREGFSVVALTPDGDTTLRAFSGQRPTRVALVIGNEGSGVGPELRGLVDHTIRIPMVRRVDSINVATASGIALSWLAEAVGNGPY